MKGFLFTGRKVEEQAKVAGFRQVHSSKLDSKNIEFTHILRHTLVCITFLMVWLCSFVSLNAQDIHSSQEFAIAPVYHPASTGRFDGFYRLGAAYRDQWRTIPANFQTFSFFGDMSFPTSKKRNPSGHFGLGVLLTADQAGDGNLSTTEIGLQSAYHQQLSRGGNVLLSAGAGLSLGNKSVEAGRLIFNNQWTESGFDPLLSNGENFASLSTRYLDVQAGLGLFVRTSLHNYVFMDASLHHINRAQISFFNADQALDFRPIASLGGRFGLRGSTAILPRIQFSTEQNARQITAGANLSWGLDYQVDGNQIIGGLWYRYGDAVVLNAGARLNDMQFIISYDLNASSLSPASRGYGAVELSLIYVGKRKDRSLQCPVNF